MEFTAISARPMTPATRRRGQEFSFQLGLPEVRGIVNGTARFVSSATVGVVWTAISPVVGFRLAALLRAAGTLALLRVKTD